MPSTSCPPAPSRRAGAAAPSRGCRWPPSPRSSSSSLAHVHLPYAVRTVIARANRHRNSVPGSGPTCEYACSPGACCGRGPRRPPTLLRGDVARPTKTDEVRAMAELKDRPTAALVHDVTELVPRLVRQELDLAKAELTEKGKRAGAGAGLLGGSGVVAWFGVAVLVAAAVLGLAEVMPAWAAALIVAAVLLAGRRRHGADGQVAGTEGRAAGAPGGDGEHEGRRPRGEGECTPMSESDKTPQSDSVREIEEEIERTRGRARRHRRGPGLQGRRPGAGQGEGDRRQGARGREGRRSPSTPRPRRPRSPSTPRPRRPRSRQEPRERDRDAQRARGPARRRTTRCTPRRSRRHARRRRSARASRRARPPSASVWYVVRRRRS